MPPPPHHQLPPSPPLIPDGCGARAEQRVARLHGHLHPPRMRAHQQRRCVSLIAQFLPSPLFVVVFRFPDPCFLLALLFFFPTVVDQASMLDGSARATAATTTRLGAFARAPPRSTSRSLLTLSWKTPRSSLVKRSPRLLLRSATGEESTARVQFASAVKENQITKLHAG